MSQSPGGVQDMPALDRYSKAWTATNALIRQGHSFSGHERHCCFLNTGSLPFADVSAASGLDLPEDGRALATADWDHDGDLDLWITNRTAPRVRFFRNDFPGTHHFLSVQLEGRTCNRDAIGARLELYFAGTDRTKRIKTLRAGDGFLGQSSKTVVFGLGPQSEVDRLVVRWPGGASEEFHGLTVDRHYSVVEGTGRAEVVTPPRPKASLASSDIRLPAPTEQARIVLAGRLPLPDVKYENQQRDLVPAVSPSLDGPLVLNLWASSCQPCVAELRELVRHHEQLRGHHVNVVTLCVDSLDGASASKNPDSVLGVAFPFASGSATPSLVDALDAVQRTVLDRKRPLPVPSSFLIDRLGRLAVIYKGRVSVEQLLADLELLEMPPRQLRNAAVPFPGSWSTPPKSTDPMLIAAALQERGLDELAESYTWQIDAFLVDDTAASNMLDESTRIRMRADAHAYRGVLLLQRNRIRDAVKALEKALEFAPRDVRLYMKLGEAHTKLGEPDQAARCLTAAVSIAPDDADAHYHLAITLTELGRARESVAHYRDALRLRPAWPPAANNLAWILATHPDPAVRNGVLAVELATDTCRRIQFRDPTGLDTLAAAQAEAGDFAAAVETASRAVDLARQQGKAALAERIERRLRLYERDQPFRDQPSSRLVP